MGSARQGWLLAVAIGALVVTAAAAGPAHPAGAARAAQPAGVPLVAVGDIADCATKEDDKVAALVSKLPGTLALLGDNVYENGTQNEFDECFRPAWGRFLPRTRAALGNHEYGSGNADAAIKLFGLPHNGWYTYRLGAWKVIVLNSNCSFVGGCDKGSPEWTWLRNVLRRGPQTACTLAYWHHPRFSSGRHGSDTTYAPFWDLLAAAHADLVLVGHDHDYERIAPRKGIRSFVVGTGGRGNYPFGSSRIAGSEASMDDVHGVLQLRLLPASFTWRFLPSAGYTFTDSGSARCR
jgi:hypothetical protein